MEPHENFTITVTCIVCGWQHEDWAIYRAEEAMREHTRETDE